MSDATTPLIGPDDTAFRLELTPAQLKLTHTALKSLMDDFGHEERAVQRLVQEILAKFPAEESIRAIDISAELRRRRLTSA
jgi:hypothetical protein